MRRFRPSGADSLTRPGCAQPPSPGREWVRRSLAMLALFAFAAQALAAMTLGEEILRLQAHALPDSLSYPPERYSAVVDSLAAVFDASLPHGASPQQALHAFFRMTRFFHAHDARRDILAFDLTDGELDCTSLSIFMYDVWSACGDTLDFVVRERHVFLTDGVLDYDPLQDWCVPADRRWASAMEVTGGRELMLSLSERAVGDWLGAERFAEAETWFARALQRTPSDPVTLVRWGWLAHLAGDDALAEEKLRACATLWPDASHSIYPLGRFLAETGRYDEARWRLEIARGLAQIEEDERVLKAIEKVLKTLEENTP